MRRCGCLLRQLLDDEGGQATAEYIIMVCVAVLMAATVIKKLIQPSLAKLADALGRRLDATIFGGGGFHRLRIGR